MTHNHRHIICAWQSTCFRFHISQIFCDRLLFHLPITSYWSIKSRTIFQGLFWMFCTNFVPRNEWRIAFHLPWVFLLNYWQSPHSVKFSTVISTAYLFTESVFQCFVVFALAYIQGKFYRFNLSLSWPIWYLSSGALKTSCQYQRVNYLILF